jgi:imidazolonepropionase-like amidohydrolase
MPEKYTAVIGATLIDGTGGSPLADSIVLVRGAKIAAVGVRNAIQIPPNAERIDARGKYLLPGMIDLHTHMFVQMMVQGGVPREEPAYAALYAANNLRQALQAGVTTVRDMGGYDYLDLSVKRAITEGVILGPRTFVSGKALCMTGGHGSQSEGFARIADGPQEVRFAIREQVAMGADQIKIMTTHRTPTPEYTQGELDAAVDEAHRLGKRIACHAATIPGTCMAVRAGVDTLEHGTWLTDETADLMAAQGTFWVPTCFIINAPKSTEARLKDPNLPYAMRLELEKRVEVQWEESNCRALAQTFEMVLERGIAIGAGTDALSSTHPFAALPEEVALLVNYGCTPMQAIESATRVGAEALGRSDNLGTVQKGKYADLILVDRDPLQDITVLQEVSWVMKGGRSVPFAPEYSRLAGKRPWNLDQVRPEDKT